MNISGVILAGGENKRFGGIIKSNIEIDGSPIVSRIIRVISDIFSEIILVTNSPEHISDISNLKIVGDQYLKAGPLSGIHAGIKSASNNLVFVIAGDMPFIDKEIIVKQIEYFSSHNTNALVPMIDGKIEPLHAIYSKSLLESLDNYLTTSKQYAVRDFLKGIDVCYMNMEPSARISKAFTNINTPYEAEKAGSILKDRTL